MKHGFVASHCTPVEAVTLAVAAERAGWDGIFTWDGVSFGALESPGPWALLGALAQATSTVTLGAMVFALPRRKPWEVAREALTLDQLSGGRLVLPVGIGAPEDAAFAKVNTDSPDARDRSERLDECLEILRSTWSGERFSFHGQHFSVDEMQLRPRPVAGRIPVWSAIRWPAARSLRRAALCDGMIVQTDPLDADTLAQMAAWAAEHAAPGFDIVVQTRTEPGAAGQDLRALAEAGATWFVESRWDDDQTYEVLHERVQAGPPQLS